MAFMLPPDESPRPAPGTATTRSGPSARPARTTGGRHRPIEPIGKEKLRRLRESILNGTYPLDEAVIGGLARMFMGPAPGRRREDGE